MTLDSLIIATRRFVNDAEGSIFIKADIEYFINEAIDRIRGYKHLSSMQNLIALEQEPNPLPSAYHHLLAVYAASRCFGQDERHYQSSTFMNEFETKLDDLITKIESGDIKIVDSTGNEIEVDYIEDAVVDVYYGARNEVDLDNGVEGVE